MDFSDTLETRAPCRWQSVQGAQKATRACVTGRGTSGGGRALEKCLFPREKSELCRGAVARGCSRWSGRDAMPGAVAAMRRWERESPAQRPLAPTESCERLRLPSGPRWTSRVTFVDEADAGVSASPTRGRGPANRAAAEAPSPPRPPAAAGPSPRRPPPGHGFANVH